MKKNKNTKRSMSRTQLTIISVLVSVVLWVVIDRLADPDITYQTGGLTPVITGEEQLRANGYVLVNREEIPPCGLKVSGKRNNLIANMDNISIEINLSEVNRTGLVNVKPTINISDSLRVLKQSYKSLTLEFAAVAKKEEVNVRVEKPNDGITKDGRIIKATPVYETVTAYGTHENVERIKYCVAVLPEESEFDGTVECEYYFTDEEGGRIEDALELTCNMRTMPVIVEYYEKKTVKLGKITVPESVKEKYDLSLESSSEDIDVIIGVRNNAEVPEKLDGALSEKSEFKERGTFDASVRFEVPEDIYIPKTVKVKVKAIPLEKVKEKIIVQTSAPEDGLMISAVVPEFNSEAAEVIKPIDFKDEIIASADVAGLSAGVHSIALKFKNEEIKSTSELKVTVILAAAE